MNTGKMLSLVLDIKNGMGSQESLAELESILRNEIESDISKQTGNKNIYKAIKNFIKNARKNSVSPVCKGLLLGDDEKYYLTDTFGLVRFAEVDPKDILVLTDHKVGDWFFKLPDTFYSAETKNITLPTEKDLLISHKSQLAENGNNFVDLVSFEDINYRVDLILSLLSVMSGDIIKTEIQTNNSKMMRIEDSNGNVAVLMPY